MTSNTPSTPASRPSPSEDLRVAALEHFAAVGFAGASLQHIADQAGYSKSSVLYHFASKEALLDAALTPAIDALETMVTSLGNIAESSVERAAFIEDFIDFLFAHRLEVFTFINHGQTLTGVPVIDRATRLITELSNRVSHDGASVEERMRFGVALGGAAYSLVAGMTFVTHGDTATDAEMRDAFVVILGELLAPIATPRTR